MVKKIILLGLVIWGIGVFALADTMPAVDKNQFVYNFHLYYDNGQLLANRDFNFEYDIIADNFVPEIISTAHPFRGEIVSVKEEVLSSFRFDPQKGNVNFKKGGIAVRGPYFADAARADFYNDQGVKLLTVDVSGSSFCNDDAVCNSDVGENYQNCPNDCKRPSPSPAYQPPVPSVWQSMLIPILIAVVVIIAALIIWGIIKKKRTSAGQGQGLPPAQPLS